MLKLEIDLWPILYGIALFLVYTFCSNPKKQLKINHVTKINNVTKKNDDNVNIVSSEEDILKLECRCPTFFIDEQDYFECDYCIKKKLIQVENSKNRNKI